MKDTREDGHPALGESLPSGPVDSPVVVAEARRGFFHCRGLIDLAKVFWGG